MSEDVITIKVSPDQAEAIINAAMAKIAELIPLATSDSEDRFHAQQEIVKWALLVEDLVNA